jgi:hypothetical protein
MDKLWDIHTVESYLAMRKKTIQMKLQNTNVEKKKPKKEYVLYN